MRTLTQRELEALQGGFGLVIRTFSDSTGPYYPPPVEPM